MDIRCKNPAFLGGPMMVGDETVNIPANGVLCDVPKKLADAMLGLPAFFEVYGAPAPAPAAKPTAKSKKSDAKSAPKKTGVLKRMGRALSGEGEE
jgi:hypothetical protein